MSEKSVLYIPPVERLRNQRYAETQSSASHWPSPQYVNFIKERWSSHQKPSADMKTWQI